MKICHICDYEQLKIVWENERDMHLVQMFWHTDQQGISDPRLDCGCRHFWKKVSLPHCHLFTPQSLLDFVSFKAIKFVRFLFIQFELFKPFSS